MSETAVISPFSRSAELEYLEPGLQASCRVAVSLEEVSLHHAIRNAVFVEEQGFFEGTDRDAHDDDPSTVKLLGLYGPVAGAAVRVYPLDEPGLWRGDRLAVLPPFRPRTLGAPLVRFAVRTAGDRGGRLMVAFIQPRNVGFFRKLGWHTVGEPEMYVDRLHQKMAIELRAHRAGSQG